MIKNIIHLTFDGLGNNLKKTGVFKGRSNMIDVVQVCSPMPAMPLGVNFKLYNATQTEYNQFMTFTETKGKDIFSQSDELYQRAFDWNVWEIEVDENVLLDVLYFRSAKVSLSFKWRAFSPSANCVTYQGVFGASYPLPVGENAGDWWYCDGQFNFAGIKFGDKTIMYYDGENYHMDTYEEELTTTPQDMPIDKNMSVQSFTSSEVLELTTIKGDIEDLKIKAADGLKVFDSFEEANAENLSDDVYALIVTEIIEE